MRAARLVGTGHGCEAVCKWCVGQTPTPAPLRAQPRPRALERELRQREAVLPAHRRVGVQLQRER